jgi:hypothetical protein
VDAPLPDAMNDTVHPHLLHSSEYHFFLKVIHEKRTLVTCIDKHSILKEALNNGLSPHFMAAQQGVRHTPLF